MRIFACLTALLLCGLALGARPGPGDEFAGPFPSWANVRDYGAVGDGKADDTAAIQKALDDLRQSNFPKRVLWFPAGTYRITDTLKLLRGTHNESNGLCIFGEDPEKTILKWDGPVDGVMFLYNPWYACLGRLTFDGAGKAKTAIQHGEAFSTANEYKDVVIKNVQYGIEAGMVNGIAETAVLRCRFYRCSQIAVSIQNFNSLDWYLWNCYFEDCGIGVSNERVAGNFHVYESVFYHSREADVTIKNCGYFTLYGNLSVGSRMFLDAKRAPIWKDTETWAANFTVQKNRILDSSAPPIICLNNGPLMLLDNVFQLAPTAARAALQDNTLPSAPGARAGAAITVAPTSGEADVISIGNTFTNPLHYAVTGRLHEVDDKTVPANRFETAPPEPYPFLPLAKRPVIETVGQDEVGIQAAIDEAARLNGQRPIVHLPAGNYNIKATITIPAGTDLQLVGDGMAQATQLNWSGPGEGPILRIVGPTHATIRQIGMSGGKTARCIVASGLDQAGGRVFMEQTQTNGYGYGLVVDGLDKTNVELHDHGHNSLQVLGGLAAAGGTRPPGMTMLFCGASSRDLGSQDQGIDLYNVAQGGRLLVRDIWYEGQIWHFMHFTGRGEFTYHSGNIAPYQPPPTGEAVMDFDGFKGDVTFSQIEPMNGPIRVKDAPNLQLLMIGLITRDAPLQLQDAGGAQVAFLSGRVVRQAPTGSDALPDLGAWDPLWVKARLAVLRETAPQPLTPIPDGITDLRLYRVMTYGKEGVRLEGRP
jgi:hypothetical protein